MSSAAQNPFVGPRAFEADDRARFFGRDTERELLASLVMTHRDVLLFAVSGAGKSSLLRAGLVPDLTRRRSVGRGRYRREVQKMEVLPVATVSGTLSDTLEQGAVSNIFVFNALSSLLPDAPPEELCGLDLTAGLQRYSDENYHGEAPPVPGDLLSPDLDTLLIFDQFEELFTLHTHRREEREGFFTQLLEAQKRLEDLRVLMVMREDYLGEMTPYAHRFPDQLDARFRLERLRSREALSAVTEPAADAGCPFTEDAARTLVENLSREHGGRQGEYVEPVQLQVVCHELWRNLPAGSRRIGTELLREVGDVDQALARFYAGEVKRVAGDTGVPRRTIRDWVEERLILEGRLRGQCARVEDPARQGLPHAAIMALVDAHLVRAEERRGATWYELAHDRLVAPIVRDNAAWREANLVPLQVQAALWDGESRPDGLLLRGPALDEAERWAGEQSALLNEVEALFLERCGQERQREREALAQQEKEREQALELERSQALAQSRRLQAKIVMAALVACLALLVLAGAGWYRAMEQSEEAQRQKLKAEDNEALARRAAEIQRRARLESERAKRMVERLLEQARVQTKLAEERLEALKKEQEMSEKARALAASTGTGAIACYSRNAPGSTHGVGGGIYVMGIIDGMKGRYIGRIFHPRGHEGKDISAAQKFKDLCNYRFPSTCKGGCWAGGDTGGYYGYR